MQVRLAGFSCRLQALTQRQSGASPERKRMLIHGQTCMEGGIIPIRASSPFFLHAEPSFPIADAAGKPVVGVKVPRGTASVCPSNVLGALAVPVTS